MPLCGLRSQAHLFMCNSKTLASKLLLFKGGSCNNSITSFKLQSLLLCTSLPASHSLFCPELERNDKSKTKNKLLESFSNTVNARKYILLVWKMNSFCFMMHLLGALLMPMMNDTFSFLLCCYFAKSSQNSCSWKMERIYSLVVALERHLPQDLFFR